MFKEIRYYKSVAILVLIACVIVYFFGFYSYYDQKNSYEEKQVKFTRLSREVAAELELLVKRAHEENERIRRSLEAYGGTGVLVEDPVELKFLISKKVGEWQENFHAPNNYFGFESCCKEGGIAAQDSIFRWNLLLNVTGNLLEEMSSVGIKKIYCYEETQGERRDLGGLIVLPIHLKFEASIVVFRELLEKLGTEVFPLFLKSAEIKLLEKEQGKAIFGLNFEYIQYQGEENV